MAKYDNNLTFLYSENARMKIKEMAGLLRKSPQRLKYSIMQLENQNILNNLHCIFDYSYFGLLLFRVYFKGGYISEKDRYNTLKTLGENPYVTSVYELSGEFDLAVDMMSPNPSRFNKELKKMGSVIPTLTDYKVILNVVTHVYPKSYLTTDEALSPPDRDTVVGGDRTVEKFTDEEMAVMKYLFYNPQTRMTTLARKSGMNVKTAKSIIKNLKGRRIIKGFKYMLDTNKLEIHKYRLFLNLHNVTQEREKQLMDYLLHTKEVVQFNKTVGDWEMEVDIESPDKNRIRKLIMEIREEFKDLIESFNITEFYKYYKKSYLPVYLFHPELAAPPPKLGPPPK